MDGIISVYLQPVNSSVMSEWWPSPRKVERTHRFINHITARTETPSVVVWPCCNSLMPCIHSELLNALRAVSADITSGGKMSRGDQSKQKKKERKSFSIGSSFPLEFYRINALEQREICLTPNSLHQDPQARRQGLS